MKYIDNAAVTFPLQKKVLENVSDFIIFDYILKIWYNVKVIIFFSKQ